MMQPRRVSVLLAVLLCTLYHLCNTTELNGSFSEGHAGSGQHEDEVEDGDKFNDPRLPYPADAFSLEERRRGWALLHVAGMLYMFASLALVSHEFFIPALGVITEKLSTSDDVAGATVMAAGRSAPKLCTSLIGAFISNSNVGFGNIVGSAVYNILVLVGVCGLLSRNVTRLSWWPMIRDASFYTLDLVLLIIFFLDGIIVWHECLILVLSYVSYLVFMKFNSRIRQRFRCGAPLDTQMDGTSLEPVQGNLAVELAGEIQRTKSVAKGKREGPLSLKWSDTPGKQVVHLLLLPVIVPLWLTLPDVRNPKSTQFFPATFLGSILWITVFTYFLVWWSNTVGETLRIPEQVMGLTVLALGTSVPDIVTSVTVARRGCGDMVVSSSVGNNIFNVAVGLPLPWLLYSLSHGLSPVIVSTTGLNCAAMLLFLMLVLFFAAVLICKQKLCKVLGAALLLPYMMFVGVSVALEYRVMVCPL